MTSARDWRLVFNCPACKEDSELAATNLGAIVRCPHCRTIVVIERDGMCKASHRNRRAKSTHQAKQQYDELFDPHEKETARSWSWVGLTLVVGIVIVCVFPWSRSNGLTSESALRSAVIGFQTAWLAGDLTTAKNFVVTTDQRVLATWSAPRRAALLAGFGPRMRGHVKKVEFELKNENLAVVRVVFQIQSTEQQAFQHWRLEDGAWKLCLSDN